MGRDQWYLEICDKIAEMSKCLSRKVGAIIMRAYHIAERVLRNKEEKAALKPLVEKFSSIS